MLVRASSVVSLGCLTATAYFVASGVAELLGGAAVEAAALAPAPVRARGPSLEEAAARAPRDGAAILERNVFDSSARPRPTSSALGLCDGRYRLVSVVASTVASESFVTLQAGATHVQARLGGLAGNAAILGIGWRSALLQPPHGPACRLALLEPRPASPSASPPSTPEPRRAAASTGDPSLDAALAAGVRATGEGTFEVDRALVDQVIASPAALARTRVQPVMEDGEVTGFKIYGVRRGGVLSAIGLENGDVLHAVGDLALTSPAAALQALPTLRRARHLTLRLTRRGQPRTIEVEVR
jgi:hypothetical protein